MAILSGREKPLANDGRAGHLRGANSAADLFDKLKAGSAATTACSLIYRKRLMIDKR